MSSTDELISNNSSYVAGFAKGDLPLPPAKKVAVLACMDARLDPAKALGLQEGDAHVIRNAGGVASEDAVRSLVISQRLLGTEEIILIHHTDCGMETFSDDAVKEQILADTGLRPSFALEAFPKVEDGCQTDRSPHQGQPVRPPKEHPRLRLRGRDRAAARGPVGLSGVRWRRQVGRDRPCRAQRRGRGAKILTRQLGYEPGGGVRGVEAGLAVAVQREAI